ncbi:uncharacterized protein [Linepithema humile]|uniref:uncharacterized protein isoform X3 n=1 Tax=Linepithema humile TaxID=83485 RepID=UPI0006233050|nr:PREDICTED: uncharacterized protein LOC105671330 isoform X2 [Linepithema humile]
MWTNILDLPIYDCKILSIFIFVELCIVAFLTILHHNEIMELKKRNHKDADKHLQKLTDKLTEKKRVFQRYRTEIKNLENILSDVENKTLSYRDRYRFVMTALKKDVRKTEIEMKMLHGHISKLSFRREELKNEVLKQGEDYRRLIDNFAKDLGHNEVIFSMLI